MDPDDFAIVVSRGFGDGEFFKEASGVFFAF